ncbi:MAG: DUF2787 domain-containing protein [Marinomonas sp.]|uniref:DUF2787 domain-containing protein n=1 Tax=Marinomonas sp. TaxID=1904862 RepID=UPI003F9855BC
MSAQISAISFCKSVLPISTEFMDQLRRVIGEHVVDLNDNHITINFRDSSYSAVKGGYHPVEISLIKMAEHHYVISYITDFSYCGHSPEELERDLDFDFGNSLALSRPFGWIDISLPEIAELYQLWESNFIAYLTMDVYDQIQIQRL